MEDVIFRGDRFRLYEHYFISTRTSEYLHRVVWESHNGPLPDDFHVHHKDGDKLNNAIENLEALPSTKHRKLHAQESVWHHSEECRQHLRRIASLRKNWTPDSLQRQSALAKSWWDRQPLLEKLCAVCGGIFHAKRATARYCSKRCENKFFYKGKSGK